MQEVTVNELFTQTITKVDSNYVPPALKDTWYKTRMVQNVFGQIIDKLGEKSALNQNLNKPITTTEKLYKSPAHILYLLKDSQRNGGKGEIIGMLKVGSKHLYLSDDQGKTHEVDPICVLDFYVNNDVQRKGYGKQLFDHMLQDMNVHPHKLAIDGPSSKMEAFLNRKYGIERLVKQSNNFAVAAQFFDHIDEIKSHCSVSQNGAEQPSGSGRFTAMQRRSTVGSIISGYPASGSMFNSSQQSNPENDNEKPEAANAEPSPTSFHDTLPENLIELTMECISINEPMFNNIIERPTVLNVEPIANSSIPPPTPGRLANSSIPLLTPGRSADSSIPPTTPGNSADRDPQLTERGYVDLKYFHNKLW